MPRASMPTSRTSLIVTSETDHRFVICPFTGVVHPNDERVLSDGRADESSGLLQAWRAAAEQTDSQIPKTAETAGKRHERNGK